MNSCVVATQFENKDGDDRWTYIVSGFVEFLREM